ncbi:hypothetical protein BaRGS_00009636 [Batillaria attramentaria]|uniref:PH domain-containing protein n=1 Tax=Batillaria attramentaria TaxID=370345 RepID=A0ABD0LJD8_9CAEN
MAVEDIRRSMWHAFTALAKEEQGEVKKTRLKVLTNNIGRALGKDKAEEILEDAEDSLTFTEYYKIIEPKLLQPENTEQLQLLTPKVIMEIDKICWMLCEGYYLKNSELSQRRSTDNGDDLFKLWKVFNFLAKIDPESQIDNLVGVAALPIRVDLEEAYRIGSLIRQSVGYDPSECPTINPDADSTMQKFLCDFVRFVVIVGTAVQDLPADVFRHGIECASEEILNDVIKKGYLDKYGNHVTNWKKRWFRLTASEMKYFTTDLERDLKGSIEVCKDFRPESQKAGQHRQFRIKLHTMGRSFELAASDLRSKNEWMTALQKAADHFGKEGSFQKCELEERERQRMLRREKIAEEEFGKTMMKEALEHRDKQLEEEHQERLKDKSLLKKREEELEAERQARLDVEARLAEEAAQLEAERLRLKELEEIKAMLERLLEEERQAKRDEEIVRNLQAKLLEEEMEKREELERLKAEQERLLQLERKEKEGLERQWQEQESMLNKTQQQLDRLRAERQQAEQKIIAAEEKMKLAEVERQKMQEKLRLREMSTSVGLRGPRPTPNPDPFITHRGKGAFVEADFTKKVGGEAMSPSRDASGQHSDERLFSFNESEANKNEPEANKTASEATVTEPESKTNTETGDIPEGLEEWMKERQEHKAGERNDQVYMNVDISQSTDSGEPLVTLLE